MTRTTTLLSSLFLLLTAFALSANAQTTRVYVAASGSDANACTLQSPCQTITKALSVVDARGEVVITENGDYDHEVGINKSVTISAAPGISANLIPEDGGVAIVTTKFLTPSDTVTLRNLNIRSTINPGTAAGILNQSAGALNVDGCTFTGLNEAIGSAAGFVYVHDTTIRNCGVAVHSNGSLLVEGLVRLTVDHCHIEQNMYGVYVDPKVFLTVRDTVLAGNSTAAIYIFSNKAGLFDDVTVDNCLISNNNGGVMAYTFNGGSVTARLERNTIVRNSTGVLASYPNTTIYTLQNNVIDANGTNVSGALTPQPLK